MAVGKLYERNGRMMTINQIAAEVGLSIETVRRQIKKKGDANLVGRDNLHEIPPPLTNGKQYSWAELGKMAGVSGETMRNRVLRMGMNVDEAISVGKYPLRSNDAKKKIRCSENAKEQILKLWDCGERSIEDVERITGYPRTIISVVLPVEDILEQERRDALRKYGYAVRAM